MVFVSRTPHQYTGRHIDDANDSIPQKAPVSGLDGVNRQPQALRFRVALWQNTTQVLLDGSHVFAKFFLVFAGLILVGISVEESPG